MNWHYECDGNAVGPADEAVIAELAKAGSIQSDTLVWNEAMSDWKQACNTELASYFTSKEGTPPPLPRKDAKAFQANSLLEKLFDKSGRTPHFALLNVVLPGIAERFAGEHHLAAKPAHSGDFDARRGHRHDDGRLATQAFGRKGHTLGMIAGRCRYDTPAKFFGAEPGHFIVGPS